MMCHLKIAGAGLAFAAILAAVPVRAQTPDCTAPQDQQSMNACARIDWEQADARLNAVWRDVMGRLKAVDATAGEGEVPVSKLLRDAQRAWIEFRDTACLAESAPMRGGSAERLLFWGCMARMTRQRTQELIDFGDLF